MHHFLMSRAGVEAKCPSYWEAPSHSLFQNHHIRNCANYFLVPVHLQPFAEEINNLQTADSKVSPTMID